MIVVQQTEEPQQIYLKGSSRFVSNKSFEMSMRQDFMKTEKKEGVNLFFRKGLCIKSLVCQCQQEHCHFLFNIFVFF